MSTLRARVIINPHVSIHIFFSKFFFLLFFVPTTCVSIWRNWLSHQITAHFLHKKEMAEERETSPRDFFLHARSTMFLVVVSSSFFYIFISFLGGCRPSRKGKIVDWSSCAHISLKRERVFPKEACIMDVRGMLTVAPLSIEWMTVFPFEKAF